MFAIGDKEWAGLSKMLEEAGEVIQVGGKLIGSRGATDHWSGDLREKLVEELADLFAAMMFFGEKNLSDAEADAIMDRAEKKIELFMKWHDEDNESRSN